MTERKWYDYSQGLHRRIKELEEENARLREVLELTALAAVKALRAGVVKPTSKPRRRSA